MEEWVSLEDLGFLNYSISSWGRVRNTKTGRYMRTTLNTTGFEKVGLMRGTDRVTLSITPLVAQHFLPRHDVPDLFTTPIHLDGNKQHNYVENLAWRPLWFAVKYHQQFKDQSNWIRVPIIDVDTEEIYEDAREAVIRNGILAKDIFFSITNGSSCFPTRQVFDFLA